MKIGTFHWRTRLGWQYVIAEFPEILSRVPISGLVFDAYVYPFDSKLVEFVENIQKVQSSLKSRKNSRYRAKVFLEVRE